MAGTSSSSVLAEEKVVEVEQNEEAPLISNGECRICQEEDSLDNLETPCSCNGSLKLAHRKCIQHWCNQKGNITCEICHQPYEPGYTVPRPYPEETVIDIGGVWQLSGTPLDLHGARLLAIAEAERQLLETDYEEYHSSIGGGAAALCRSAAFILMALLLLRHALSLTDGDEDDDPSTFISLFLIRAAGFLLPCYIMIWAISILQSRRQHQEAAAMVARPPHFAFVVQSSPSSNVHLGIAPAGPTPAIATILYEERV